MSDVQKRICPHCGGTQFMAYIKRGGIVESDGIDKEGNPKFKIIKEGAKDNFEVEVIKCAKCQNGITEADLVESCKCKKCGKMVNPTDLNENDICPVCAMLETNPNIADMSADDLRFLLAKMMMQTGSVKKNVETKTAKAEKVEEKAAAVQEAPAVEEAPAEEPKSGDDVLADVLSGNGEAGSTKQPKRRKMKKGDSKAESSTEAAAEEPAQETAQQDIAESQDAPFPDVDQDIMNPPQDEEQPIGAGGFKMFDDNEGEEEQPF